MGLRYLAGYHASLLKNLRRDPYFFSNKKMKAPVVIFLGARCSSLPAGLSSTGTTQSDILIQRAMGREFIINMKKKYSIDKDLYFNNYEYDPDYKDPFWKATIKQIVGWQKSEVEKTAIIENNVLANFRQNVMLEVTDVGAIELSVTIRPQKASYYANMFMEEIRQMVEQEIMLSPLTNYLSEI